jgi:DNA-binding FadR family transcriptional regulator
LPPPWRSVFYPVRGRKTINLPADTALCAEFDVSRTVIREALRLLSAKGLIICRPETRHPMSPCAQNWALWDKDVLNWLSKTDLSDNKYDFSSDALDMRLALEPTFAALAASRADEAANMALQDALQQLQQTPIKTPTKTHMPGFWPVFMAPPKMPLRWPFCRWQLFTGP